MISSAEDLVREMFVPTLPPRRDEIASVLRADILSGRRPPHSRLPSTAELAAEQGVSLDTAYRAYRDLHTEGLIYGRKGLGRYVAEVSDADPRPDTQ